MHKLAQWLQDSPSHIECNVVDVVYFKAGVAREPMPTRHDVAPEDSSTIPDEIWVRPRPYDPCKFRHGGPVVFTPVTAGAQRISCCSPTLIQLHMNCSNTDGFYDISARFEIRTLGYRCTGVMSSLELSKPQSYVS